MIQEERVLRWQLLNDPKMHRRQMYNMKKTIKVKQQKYILFQSLNTIDRFPPVFFPVFSISSIGISSVLSEYALSVLRVCSVSSKVFSANIHLRMTFLSIIFFSNFNCVCLILFFLCYVNYVNYPPLKNLERKNYTQHEQCSLFLPFVPSSEACRQHDF